MQQSRAILKKYWGFDQFRPLQEDIADAVIYGKDVLALLPTGGGKSICFQVPGLAREGICLVISPLIALMDDQVEQLKKRGIKAQAITSGMSYKEIDIALDQARFGGVKFLYTSPERLQTRVFQARFKLMQVALIVVDEAHCISEWGHDFRPPYRQIAQLREMHPEVPIIALTATATEHVKEDIITQLKLKQVNRFEGDFQRPNISYEVYPVRNKMQSILETVRRFDGNTGIIYCQRRRSVKEIAQWLISNGVKTGIYHGGMDKAAREQMMQAWLKDKVHVMVATNAFGMGIDKPDVRFVAHYEFPNNPEAYFQEAGRAGRDGLEARTFVFYEQIDLQQTENQVIQQFPEIQLVKNVYLALCNHLKLAIGSGEGESYPLEIKAFCRQFKLDIVEAYQALKILEMNGDITFSENFFHPTKLKFQVGNIVLYNFQIKHDKTANLITLLSRSYPGIFDQFIELHDAEFCKRLKISQKELENQLQFLEQNGIIEVNWKTDLPLVTFTHQRLPDEFLQLNPEVYHLRKERALNRWRIMRDFLTQGHCRAQFLIAYFGQQAEPCGKCDYCRDQKNSTYSFEELVVAVESCLSEPLTLDQIKQSLSYHSEANLLKVLSWLTLEERLCIRDGKYQKS